MTACSRRIGRQLDLEEELEEFWLAHERLGPLQRWMAALQAGGAGPLCRAGS